MKNLMFLFLIFILSGWTSNHLNLEPKKISGKITSSEDGQALPGVSVIIKGTGKGTVSDLKGKYEITVSDENSVLVFSYIGFKNQEVPVKQQSEINIKMQPDISALSEVVITGYSRQKIMGRAVKPEANPISMFQDYETKITHNTEEYATIHDNIFQETTKNPLSTFSIDVDNASYSNMRRYIHNGQMPPKDAVRIEEMINYFTYDYPQPKGEDPFSINTEISECPWNQKHRLVHIGLQGKNIPTEDLPPSNLVFLIDVSGSMNTPERLPLVKAAFKLLINELRQQDDVAIVVYAGAAGLILPPTSGENKKALFDAIERLEAGGSTAGGAGIKLAYKIAQENFKRKGNNRVILATDGDFNVGVSSNAEMERLIEKQRESGVYLTVLGFGMGNYKDSKMEILANKGNGNYAYIDNILEAKKVFVNEFGGTLFTIAKDVKLQIEFNPTKVKAYRLIGYENRVLRNEDFNNDKKDAGDLGSGHTVTALYEIIPADVAASPFINEVDNLKYQTNKIKKEAFASKELLTMKLRYKQPDGDISKLISKTVIDSNTKFNQTSDNFRFSAAVASFGMLLRDSEFKGTSTYSDVYALAQGATGKDEEGYRLEFLKLVKSMMMVAKK
jgi:Ca-activated chloride channel homolog